MSAFNSVKAFLAGVMSSLFLFGVVEFLMYLDLQGLSSSSESCPLLLDGLIISLDCFLSSVVLSDLFSCFAKSLFKWDE